MVEKELIKQTAKKHNLTQGQVEEMLNLQFRFVAHVIGKKSDRSELHFPSIRVMGLGIFHSPEFIKEYYKKKQLKL